MIENAVYIIERLACSPDKRPVALTCQSLAIDARHLKTLRGVERHWETLQCELLDVIIWLPKSRL